MLINCSQFTFMVILALSLFFYVADDVDDDVDDDIYRTCCALSPR